VLNNIAKTNKCQAEFSGEFSGAYMKKKKKWIVIAAIVAVLIIAALLFLNKRGRTDIVVDSSIAHLDVVSSAFPNLGAMPDKYTGRGADLSPPLELSELMEDAKSIAIIMDDLDIPWKSNYTHWVIWNIPASTHIPEGIPRGGAVQELGGAIQGVAFGRNRYRGPAPPFGTHRYQFHVFVLDTAIDLDSSCGKGDLIGAMDGHILQYGSLTGWYPRESN
jgi:Raf kinase inhibitor-like YbhB/YbcL family protein